MLSIVGKIVPWQDHCALVISEFADTVTLLAWDGDGCGSTLFNVARGEVDAAMDRVVTAVVPAPVLPPADGEGA